MINPSKIKIALLLSMVFITRIILADAVVLSSLCQEQQKISSPAHISNYTKGQYLSDVSDPNTDNYGIMAVGDDTINPSVKFKPFFLYIIALLFVPLTAGICSNQQFKLFSGGLSFVSTQRYLALRVFRL
jgi:hypothetical protein